MRLAFGIGFLLAQHTSAKGVIETRERNFAEPRLGAFPGNRRFGRKEFSDLTGFGDDVLCLDKMVNESQRNRLLRVQEPARHRQFLVLRPTEMKAHPIRPHDAGNTGDFRLAHPRPGMGDPLFGNQRHLEPATGRNAVQRGDQWFLSQ